MTPQQNTARCLLRSALVELKVMVDANTAYESICGSVYHSLKLWGEGHNYNAALRELEWLFARWDKCVTHVYPVPNPTVSCHLGFKQRYDGAMIAFHHAKDIGSFWDGDYGALRKELLAHCLREAQKDGYVV